MNEGHHYSLGWSLWCKLVYAMVKETMAAWYFISSQDWLLWVVDVYGKYDTKLALSFSKYYFLEDYYSSFKLGFRLIL